MEAIRNCEGTDQRRQAEQSGCGFPASKSLLSQSGCIPIVTLRLHRTHILLLPRPHLRPRLLLWMRRPSPWINGLLRPPPSLQCAHHRMQLPCSAIFLTSSSSSSSSPPLIAYLNARSTTVKTRRLAKTTATYFVTVAATSEYVK